MSTIMPDTAPDALPTAGAEAAEILDLVPAVVVTLDATGHVLAANAAARSMTRPMESREVDRAVLHSGTALRARTERWDDPDGEPRWMRVDRLPFADRTSGAARLLVVASDVSETVAKEQALAEANEALKHFATVASHDLQEPLRKIGTFVDVLTEGLAVGNAEDVAYSSRVIQKSARRASALIKDLLSWSRLASPAVERRPLPFAELVREIVADVRAARPSEPGEIIDRMDEITVSADATHVRQLVENLVVNALKYRHPDRPARITLRLFRERGQAVFEVEDEGIGFDPAQARRIFEPFRRLHADKDYDGTGVGLAICARVCERHGWSIEAIGRPDEGATFRVGLGRPAVARS